MAIDERIKIVFLVTKNIHFACQKELAEVEPE